MPLHSRDGCSNPAPAGWHVGFQIGSSVSSAWLTQEPDWGVGQRLRCPWCLCQEHGLLRCPPCTSPSKRFTEPQACPVPAGPVGLMPQCQSSHVCCRGGGPSARMGGETKTALWWGTAPHRSCRPSIWGCHSPAKPTLLVAVPVTSGKVMSFYPDLGALPLSPKQIPLIECLINT